MEPGRWVKPIWLLNYSVRRNFNRYIGLIFGWIRLWQISLPDTLNPQTIIENIELRFNININLNQDLIFFDEVGDCQRAVDSLKYFSEDLPYAFVCASGSNIELLESFPVGSVHHLELFPLCFEEFLMAKQNAKLLESFRERRDSKVVFDQLWLTLLDYYFVGGMPEAIMHWINDQDNLSERVSNVTRIHRELVMGYRQDFGKYAGKLHALHIDSVFSSVPRQLAALPGRFCSAVQIQRCCGEKATISRPSRPY